VAAVAAADTTVAAVAVVDTTVAVAAEETAGKPQTIFENPKEPNTAPFFMCLIFLPRMNPRILLNTLLASLLLQACAEPTTDASTPTAAPISNKIPYPLQQDTTLQIGGMAVSILLPEGPVRADLLVLPGWNYGRMDWCQRTQLCQAARAAGYRLVLPDMHRTLYPWRIYPETRADFRAYATRPWIWDTLIHTLASQHGVLAPGGKNLVMGLSTGARGASLLCLDRPGYFAAVALLSGDYDLPSMPQERISTATYGPYSQHPARWADSLENPMSRAARWRTPVYIGHGLADRVIDPGQSRQFHAALGQGAGVATVLHPASGAGHDYAYWSSETEAILAFFRQQLGGQVK
jgi:pimeloyl-ACP methyl ester carboxylesterase